ncbi:MAG TPA: DNA polymerase IV [Acidimicrobiales bacterium]|nr:DNA polymerase IV [Acidimicrobiales bacterium]
MNRKVISSAIGDRRNLANRIAHVDMDCFFAAVEILDNESLRGRPVVVGGTGPRGVVASCSYQARAYGIRSAMPIAIAKQKCADCVVIAGRYERYLELSRQVYSILTRFAPVVEAVSIDEAFLDVSGIVGRFNGEVGLGHAIRSTVKDELRLDCSIGIGGNKMIAKLASRQAKPIVGPTSLTAKSQKPGPSEGQGVTYVSDDELLEFLHPLPISSLSGIGSATRERLWHIGVETVGDLARVPVQSLFSRLGGNSAMRLHDLAWGRDPRPVEPNGDPKTISCEETFSQDIRSPVQLDKELFRLADNVFHRMASNGWSARTVTLKIRFPDFKTVERSRTMVEPAKSVFEVLSAARCLLGEFDISVGIRLVGVGVSNLVPEFGFATQLSLIPSSSPIIPGATSGNVLVSRPNHSGGPRLGNGAKGIFSTGGNISPPSMGNMEEVSKVVEQIRAKFGVDALVPAVLLENGSIRVKRRGDTQWGPSESGT